MTGKEGRHQRRDGIESCGICGRPADEVRLNSIEWVRPTIAAVLDRLHPGWRGTGWICLEDLQRARRQALEESIRQERGELTELDTSVIASLERNEPLTANIEREYIGDISFAERAADAVAAFVGSWGFIFTFTGAMVIWIALNSWVLLQQPFDPFPYILLNLILSLIAAIQAPLIMMSQRRQETKDRLRSQNDYKVNLKAELEIRHLHEKLDHHLLRQWERLTDIQDMQIEILDGELPSPAAPPHKVGTRRSAPKK